MAHPDQVQFCCSVKQRFPGFFLGKFVLDVGSLDINGNNQYLFEDCLYLGVDLAVGRNVDVICKGHELSLPDGTFDTVVSTECFEHDQYYAKSLRNILRMLKPGGLFIFTCATTGRPEHGTLRTSAVDAPFLVEYGEWANYYKNLEESDIRAILDVDAMFSSYEFRVNDSSHDLYFWGIKAGAFPVRMDYSFQLKSASLRAVLKERVESLQENIAAKEKLLERALVAVADRDRLVERLVREKKDSTQALSDSKDLLAAKERDLAGQMLKLDALLNSTSWKITAPLRTLMRAIRRVTSPSAL